MSIREAMPLPNHPPGALPLDPAGGLPFPRLPVPPPDPGCATVFLYLAGFLECRTIKLKAVPGP